MIPPAKLLLRLGLIIAGVGAFAASASIARYISNPRALDSMSGLVVFREGYQWTDQPKFELVQYPPFVLGIEPVIIVSGIALVVAAVAIAAAAWTPERAAIIKPKKPFKTWG